MYQRLDHLADLGTTIITISGGEPLLHPDLDLIIARIRHHGMIAGMITNGYLLTADRIQRLNRAGLDHLQISIDNVMPDDVSKKSLKVLDKKLQLLAEHAEFHVNINSVVGGGIHNPKDALIIGKRALELGFTSTVGIIHDGDGQLQPLHERRARGLPGDALHGEEQLRAHQLFPGQHRARQRESVALPRRRALSLYLRGRPGALLFAAARLSGQAARWNTPWRTFAANTARRRAARRAAPWPACTRFRTMDFWRDPQDLTTSQAGASQPQGLVQLQ